MIQLVYFSFCASHPPNPAPSKTVFFLDLGEDRFVVLNSLLIHSCFQMCLRILSAQSVTVSQPCVVRGLNGDENLALLICDIVLCCLLFLPVITRSERVQGGCLGNSVSAGSSSMKAPRHRHRMRIGLDNICTNFMPIKVRPLKQARSLSHSYDYC